MPAVWTPRHRGHAPNGGYWLGVREVGDEEPERGDTLHDQLRDAGVHDRRRARRRARSDHGRARRRVRRLHVARRTRRGSPRVTSTIPGQPQVVPYLFATAGYAARYAAGLAAGDDPGRGRAVRDGHDVAHQRGDVRRRLLRRPRRRPRQRPRARRAASGVRGGAASGSSRRARVLRRVVLLQQRRGRRPAAARRRCRTRCDRRHRRPPGQWHAGDLLGARATSSTRACTSIRRPDGSRTSSGTPTSVGGGDGEGATVNEPIPPGSGDEPWLAALGRLCDAVRRHRAGRRRRVARRRRGRRRSGGAADGHRRRLRGGRARCSPRSAFRPCSCRRAATTCPASARSCWRCSRDSSAPIETRLNASEPTVCVAGTTLPGRER